ncbi:T7SS effector LXG polymorphic toxin [Listeria grandensis]|uniref:T7SS effector LXG polymorphic toxin n=1 Tax=Listeria grandensis TaxID=1494963 RepID=UPI00164DD2BD|nr:T7SS effector LXG polymorphic toxin [Listeria grandensis]MBC6314044.1 hypothetical protein [Listeria grandensis]
MPRIDIGEVRYFVEHFLRESQKLKEALTNYRKAVAKIVADNEIKGEIADSAKDYYEMVHYPIVDTTKACMTDAEEILKKYTTDFHNQVDPSMNARIDSDELQELQGEIRKCQNRYEDLLVKMKSMAGGSSLGQQIGMQLGMQTAMGQLQHEMQIIERYLDFDMSHQNVMYDVLTKLYQVKQGLNEIQSSKAFNTVSHTFNTKALNMGWLKNLTSEKKDPYAKYEKTLHGSYWVLTKNGKTDAEAAEATIAYNKGINDGTIKVPRDENADLDAERIKGALDGYDPISGHNLTSMQSFSVLAGIASGMVAIKGRSFKISKKSFDTIYTDVNMKEVFKVKRSYPKIKVPSVRNGEFNKWFDNASVKEFKTAWSDPKIRSKIEDRIRQPGGYHEWHLVSRAPKFKEWGVSMDKIKELRTLTVDVKFINPPGIHGGKGSTKAHNEILKIIDESPNYETFVSRLNVWATTRMSNGRLDLPEGLRR